MGLVNKCDICGEIYDRYPIEKSLTIYTHEWNEFICCPKSIKDEMTLCTDGVWDY